MVQSQQHHPLFDMALSGILGSGLISFFTMHDLSFIDLTEDISKPFSHKCKAFLEGTIHNYCIHFSFFLDVS